MSELNVTTLKAKAADTSPLFEDNSGRVMGQLCKAWILLDGTGAISTLASFNVSSVTDNGTGNYAVNFTNNLGSANYSVVVSGDRDVTGEANVNLGTLAVGSCTIRGITSSGTDLDTKITMAIFAND